MNHRSDALLGEGRCFQRLPPAPAVDQIEHQAALLRRHALKLGLGPVFFCLDCHRLFLNLSASDPSFLAGLYVLTCYFAFAPASAALPAVWPLKVRVGANSPSLWPTMFSVTYTGTNFLPLCTAIVCPTNSGKIVERRDQVFTTFLSLAVLSA